MTTTTLDVRCPRCAAAPGTPCENLVFGGTRPTPHPERVALTRFLVED